MALYIKKKSLLTISILIILFIVIAAVLGNYIKIDSIEAVSDTSEYRTVEPDDIRGLNELGY